MSRFSDYDDYEGEPEQILAAGRWERNAQATLKSKRGRKALAEIREALLALPEHRLIEGALCTIGGPARVPDVNDGAIAAKVAERRAFTEEFGLSFDGEEAEAAEAGRWMRQEVEDERHAIEKAAEGQGYGVCLIGAYLWHRKVKAGVDPAEAFAALPAVASSDDGDPLAATAGLASQQAGMAYTLAWELAYRNDELFRRHKTEDREITPEERYTAFLAWIDAELATDVQPAA